MVIKELSKDSTNIIKGFAIILIVLHNFLHWTTNIGENELKLYPDSVHRFIEMITNYPGTSINVLFSFLGHYGVQLFIFVSGYGLAMKYKNTQKINYKKYIIPRVIKLYSLVIFGILCYFILFFKNIELRAFVEWIITVLLMVNNLSYDRIFFNVGPWWYFSLALQLYLIYPLLHKIIFRGDVKTFIILLLFSYLLIYISFPITESLNIPLFGNFIGHLPEFLLGIALVKFGLTKINLKIILLCIVIFLFSNFYPSIFPLSFLSITILLLYLCNLIFKLPEFIYGILSYIGKISMFIFIINGPLRSFTMPYLVFQDSSIKTFGGSVIHFIIVLLVSIIMSYLYKIIFKFKNV